MSKQETISSIHSLSPAAGAMQANNHELTTGGGQNITPSKAKAILEANGLKVNTQQAAAITDFLYKLAKLTIR